MYNIASAFAEPISQALPKLPQAILTLLVGIVVLHILQWIFERVLLVSRTPRTLFDILTSISQVVLWVVLIATVFQSLGLTQIALTFSGTLAIIGIAIGTGANALVQDIISGLFLSRDRDFDVGYCIKMGDIEGEVTKIDIRKIRVKDEKGQIHVIPNSTLDKASWAVIARPDTTKPPVKNEKKRGK